MRRLRTAGPSKSAQHGSSTRDPLWDNARWIAITLVVVGHVIEVPNANDLAFSLYLTIYAFHIPLLAFVSGRFARAEPITRREGGVILRQLVLPYVLFQALWSLWSLPWRDGDFTLNLSTPYWHLWFLVALVVWRLTLPLMAATRCASFPSSSQGGSGNGSATPSASWISAARGSCGLRPQGFSSRRQWQRADIQTCGVRPCCENGSKVSGTTHAWATTSGGRRWSGWR